MTRKYNFSAGPATLPEEVLKKANEELIDWNGSGMSVMEMSHRGKEFLSIAQKAEADLRELLAIPENYRVLFLQGGASLQFSAVPLNLLNGKTSADYFLTGSWSKKAISEAKKFCNVNIVASSESEKFTTVPESSQWQLASDAAYVHYTMNETIGGVEFASIPETGEIPLVCDMSSTILSRPLDVSKFGIIYAGAQKNIGPAGLTIVIIRDDLLGKQAAQTPALLNYKTLADADSMYNTPPCYSWYMAGLVFDWIQQKGGLQAMEKHNRQKAELLYQKIDNSPFYQNPVEPKYRSLMNVPFTIQKADMDSKFLDGAKQRGLLTLKGHRSVGGMRASIYNAMPFAGVHALVDYMDEFEKENS